MQTAKANSKSKQSGKTAVRTPAVSEAVAAQAQDPVAAGSPDMKPAEPQATDIGAVNLSQKPVLPNNRQSIPRRMSGCWI